MCGLVDELHRKESQGQRDAGIQYRDVSFVHQRIEKIGIEREGFQGVKECGQHCDGVTQSLSRNFKMKKETNGMYVLPNKIIKSQEFVTQLVFVRYTIATKPCRECLP